MTHQQLPKLSHSQRRIAELLAIIAPAAFNHLERLRPVVNSSNLHSARCFRRELFVSEKVMLEAIHQAFRTPVDIFNVAESDIGKEDGDNFVVRLAAVDHAKPADRLGLKEEVAMGECFFSQDANIHRIAVAFDITYSGSFSTECADFVATKCLGNETVERWAHRGKPLRTINAQVAGAFIEFVLHGIGRNNLNVCPEFCRRFFAWRHSMPGVGLKKEFEKSMQLCVVVSHE